MRFRFFGLADPRFVLAGAAKGPPLKRLEPAHSTVTRAAMSRSSAREAAGGRHNGAVRGSIADVARRLEAASCAVVLTGAGLSTESGLPDFRSSRASGQPGAAA